MGSSQTRPPLIERLREIAREHGYALAVHGSQKRDLDLIAVPWVPGASPADDLVDAICERLPLVPKADEMIPNPEIKPHRRLGYALVGGITEREGYKYIDLSITPRSAEPVDWAAQTAQAALASERHRRAA